MEIKQIYEIMNATTKEVLGETALVVDEDLRNIVDIGIAVFDANSTDAYVRSLCDHIGKAVFVNRAYRGSVPSVLKDAWEYGAVLEKITADIPEAQENETWSLVDGESYDPNIFKAPRVSTKFYNKRVTFEIQMSFVEKQLKSAFSSAEQMNGFMSMLYNSIEKSMTVKLDSLIMKTIASMIGDTVKSDYGTSALSSKSGVKAINLLYLYNHEMFGTDTTKYITASDTLTNPDFIRFASYKMGLVKDRMSRLSKLFNVGGKDRFTPDDKLHCVLLSEFKNGANAFLMSDTYHDGFVALPNSETVPYWQGSGTTYAFTDTAKIDVITASNNNIVVTGILGVMFDDDAIGVANLNRRVTSNYNAKAEFYNNYYKMESGYFCDLNENMVVFFVA